MSKKKSQCKLWRARMKKFLRGDFLRSKELSAVTEMTVHIAHRNGSEEINFVGMDEAHIKERFSSDLSFLKRFRTCDYAIMSGDHTNSVTLFYCRDTDIDVISEKIVKAYSIATAIICLCTDEKQKKEIQCCLQKKDIEELFEGDGENDEKLLIFDKTVHDVCQKVTANNDVQLKVQAIVTCFNEQDIIGQTIQYLIDQGINVHVIDNWSTDESFHIIEESAHTSELVSYEKFPTNGPSETYDWEKLLTKVQMHSMAHCEEFDWFIHHDADEVRESPFESISGLLSGIIVADLCHYNAIDFRVVNFHLTKDGFDGTQRVLDYFTHYSIGRGIGYRKQVKAWKSSSSVDLASSGGHDVVVPERKVFPYRFLLRHYPMRSIAQAEKKIFQDRKARWNEKERNDKKWHNQYDDVQTVSDIVESEDNLKTFSRKAFYTKDLMVAISTLDRK